MNPNKRKENESFEDYKARLKIASKFKNKGRMVWDSTNEKPLQSKY